MDAFVRCQRNHRMLTLPDIHTRMCDGLRRREAMRIGGLSALGLSLPQLIQTQSVAAKEQATSHGSFGKAKSVILFWLLGGPPQHETWDPKPDAPDNIRGEFGTIHSVVPGMSVGELMPLTAACTDRIAALRAVVTKDQAHSSSGYQMLTGVPHIPLSRENVTAKAPNLAPSWAAMARALFPDQNGLPSSIVLPRNIANDGEIVWPGQTAGVLGLKHNPWTINCDPSATDFAVPDITLPEEVASDRFLDRRRLLDSLNQARQNLDQMSGVKSFSRQSQQAFDLVLGAAGQRAFDLQKESDPGARPLWSRPFRSVDAAGS